MFGWGTSGWNNTANDPYAVNYQPWSTSTSKVNTTYNDYGYGPSTNQGDGNLTGNNAYFDWGVYNQIGSDAPGTWRTLTYDEWNYVYSDRANANNLKGQATVNGVTGFILLPDDWEAPSGITFTAGTSLKFTTNTYTTAQWELMEQRGAVFLPSGGISRWLECEQCWVERWLLLRIAEQFVRRVGLVFRQWQFVHVQLQSEPRAKCASVSRFVMTISK